MSEISRNFAYDPVRQGVDTNSWRILFGSPGMNSEGRITVYSSSDSPTVMFHYADITKGTITFNINIPNAPASGDSRDFGLISPDAFENIIFRITDVFACHTMRNKKETISDNLDWNPDWTGKNINFKIIWEAGIVKFFVNNRNIYTVSGASIPYGPLSLYLSDGSTTSMTVGHISVNNAQSIFVNPATSDTTFPIVSSLSPSTSPSSSVSPSAA